MTAPTSTADVGDLEPRKDPERQVAAVRSQAGRAGARARADAGRLEGDRQVHGRAHHARRELAVSLRHVLHLLFEPGELGEAGQGLGEGRAAAVGTGPFKVDRMVPRERLELSRFDGYWDKARVPKLDKVLLFPMPEAATRTAALLAGQVDWIEVPAPDAIPRLQAGRHDASSPTSIRTTGPTSPAWSRARPGPTSACARRPTSRSTAPASTSCWAG